MSSNQVEPARRSFSLRLNLWYAAFYTLASLALFITAYAVLTSLLQEKEREVIRARVEEYRAWYEGGGLLTLQQRFMNTRKNDRTAFFVRVVGWTGSAIFMNTPEDWEGFDLKQIEAMTSGQPDAWKEVHGPREHASWMIATVPLRDRGFLQVGKSIEDTGRVLARFRLVFGVVMVGMVVIGFGAGALLTHEALRPVRQIINTARTIINTGQMNARVPVRPTGDELTELATLFNRVIEKNERLICGMREALDNVAHDLRTPMARLRGSAEMALQTPEDAAACREALADSMEESERVLTMLKTLMDISEAETGTMKLDRAPFDFAVLARDVADLYSIVAEEKNIRIETRLGDALMVQADRVRLQQALANLLDNAIKYTPEGGRVEIVAETAGGQLVVRVSDTGMGIAPADQPRIWERLYRGDKSRNQKGLGLGLCLVKAVVEAHRGAVDVSSEVDKGSVFTLRIPLGPTPA